MIRGRSVVDNPFKQRWEAFTEMWESKDIQPPALPLTIKCKKFVTLTDMGTPTNTLFQFTVFDASVLTEWQFGKLSEPSTIGGKYEFRDSKRGQHHYNDGIVLTPEDGGYFCKSMVLDTIDLS